MSKSRLEIEHTTVLSYRPCSAVKGKRGYFRETYSVSVQGVDTGVKMSVCGNLRQPVVNHSFTLNDGSRFNNIKDALLNAGHRWK